MSKQTAVRWLVSILNKEGFAPVLTNEEIQEALQMEREQIEDAFYHGITIDAYNVKDKWTEAEKYYEQTYGGKNE